METSLQSDDGKLVNWEQALEAVGGDEALLLEVTKAFLTEAPRQLALLNQAIAAGDAVVMRRAAHTIKGNARYYSANYVVQPADALEELGKAGHFEGAAQLSEKLAAMMEILLPVLVDYVQSH